MIFYFTGTGNSQYAAQKLASDGEDVVSVVECLRKDSYSFQLQENEAVGLVFPVYFGGLPIAVRQFIERLRLSQKPAYLYGVMTCGGSLAGAGAMLRERLGEAGYRLDASYAVQMPDSYMVMFPAPTEKEETKLLARAELDLERIRSKIVCRDRVFAGMSLPGRAVTAVMYPQYLRGRKTAPFHTNDSCIRCGVCAGRCPSRAISMETGSPTWVKERCTFCMSCARCGAIEYGDKLTGKVRYKHPMLRKKGGHGGGGHDHSAPSSSAGGHCASGEGAHHHG